MHKRWAWHEMIADSVCQFLKKRRDAVVLKALFLLFILFSPQRSAVNDFNTP